MQHRLSIVLAAAAALGAAHGAFAARPARQRPGGDDEFSPIVVSATRAAQSSFDLPIAIDSVDRAQIQDGQPRVNLSEALAAVPGISVQSRQNYAQDLQISIRGFGARSSFGVRGVRLYADGIPGTMPDGQGQFANFDLGSAARIEVLRGPFSALYGNSSGGVISVFTEDGPPGVRIGANAEYGTFATQRYALKAEGDRHGINYVIDAAHFRTSGYRDHSSAERNNLNSKVKFALGAANKVTLVANAIQTPYVQDPLGLTRAQLAIDPAQAGGLAVLYNTRKDLRQEQFGAILDSTLGARDELTAMTYAGHRAITQFQAIPKASEAIPTSSGGVIDLSNNYWGTDVHLRDRREIDGTPLAVTAGFAYDDLEEARRGYLNFIGNEFGVEGALRRDEADHVYDFDQYLQAEWDPGAHWRVLAGARHSLVDVVSHDHLAAPGTPVSGVRYSATDPVAGVTYEATPQLNFYAAYGRGFETPTLDELAYRSTNGAIPGLNLGLSPARSSDFEVGVKTQGRRLRADLDAFYVKTSNELAVLASAGGRTVYQNIGQTRRRGAELGLDAALGGGLRARVAYTYIRAVVAQSYATCAGLPCVPATVQAGSYLPAVPMNAFYAGLTWRYAPAGFTVTAETQSRARIYVNDRNTDAAAGYWIANLRFGLHQATRRWRFSEFLRLDNLADRAYVGSVIVNESSGKFFEPAPGRTEMLMFNAAWRED
ncbi:MAG TPA: TonB-dependent receptor [Steroidobacteraceae bacterium]|nr:TonB-dependent receptor [Steroidobacteraceae bacterium]